MRGEAAPQSSVSPAVHATGLSKRYGRRFALRDFDLTIERGEVVGLLGPNGAGKTTFVKLLLGLVRPSAGQAMVLGAPAGDRATRRRVGYLPELFRYQPWLSAHEVLALHGRLLGLEPAEAAASTADVLELVGLATRRADRVGSFSKGMQQRLGLGVALLGTPELVVLDEPTSALDPIGRLDVREIITTVRSRGTTVLLNTHLLAEAELVCDRVAVIDAGRVLAAGRLTELLGESGAVRVKVVAGSAGWRRAAAAFGECQDASDGWTTISGVDTAAIPALVAALVESGARLEAVVPAPKTLESRFLELLRSP